MKTCKDVEEVQKEQHLVLVFLLLPIFIWSLSHKPTIENNYQMYLSGVVLKIFLRKFSALLSKHLLQSLFLIKSHVFSMVCWTPWGECVWIIKVVPSGTSRLDVHFRFGRPVKLRALKVVLPERNLSTSA